jgi:hypothetical protein
MRVLVERSGGFAGISRTYSFSSDRMPAEEGRRVAELVEAAGFFGLPSVIRATEPGADRFQYKITVESGQGSHTVQVDEGAVPPGLEPVIAWMKNSAAAQAGK